jgi:hypothetical protein
MRRPACISLRAEHRAPLELFEEGVVVARKLEGEDARREARRIGDVSGWPTFPWLTVKRYVDGQRGSELAVICADDLETTRIRVFESSERLRARGDRSIGHGDTVEPDPVEVHASLEALIDAGWMSS